MDKQNPELYMAFHCIIHQQSLCGKAFEVEHVIEVVNFIQSHRLKSFGFGLFCQKLMLNVGTSCTIQMSGGWIMGQC
jgi:hypothetical protein